MKDPRKPLFPEDDESLPPLDEGDDEEADNAEAEAPPEPEPDEPVYTPPEKRFPPLDPSLMDTVQRDAVKLPPPKKSHLPHNLVTIFFTLATLALIAYFGLLWVDPYTSLNPLPPYTPLPVLITTTPLPPTASPIPSETPIPPTMTELPVPVVAPPTFTPAPFPFTLDEFGVDYQANSRDSGCDWSSIAGSVTGLDGAGLDDYSVRIRAQDGPLNATVATGAEPEFGPGGFELKLGDAAQLAPYIVQLLDPDGAPVSEEYLVVTSDQCDQNVVLIHFVQNRPAAS